MSSQVQGGKPANYLKEQLWPKLSRVFYYSVLFSLCTNVLMLFLPFYSLLVYDKVLASHSMATLALLSLIVGASFVILAMFSALRSFVVSRMSDWFDATLGPDLLKISIQNSAINPASAGSQLMRDLTTIKSFITGAGMTTMMDAPWSVIFIIVTFFIHPVMGVITLVGSIVLILLAILNEAQTKKLLENYNRDNIKSLMGAEMITKNAEAIEAMGMMRQVVDKWMEKNLKTLEGLRMATDRASIIGSVSKFFRLFIQMLLICAGAYYVMNNMVSMGAMIAGPILAGRALAPFEALIGVWKGYVSARDAVRRINHGYTSYPEIRGQMTLPKPSGRVTVENVYFRPPRTERMVLANVRFALEPGESLGIIGPSAAGKSTLAKLLVGVWLPTNGAVRLDGNDIFKWNRDDVGRYIGYMPQDVELFHATIRENIARLDPTAGAEEVVQAAIKAGVHDMIIRLPKGYDTMFEPGTLSPGQQQRIALARAFYGNPTLMVLDEPNSNLDSDGEKALIDGLRQAKLNMITTIIIAHKPSMLTHADKVLVLKDGAVDLFGPKDAVMAKLGERAQQMNKMIQQQRQSEDGSKAADAA